MKAVLAVLLVICLPLMVWPAQRQRGPQGPRLPDYVARQRSGPAEYTFARLRYPSGGWRQTWTTDYPKADYQLVLGLRGWVRSLLDIADEPDTVSLYEKKLYSYPFIYAVEPGYMDLSTEDAAKLREYLLRGGTLMLDDFWGEYEWQNVQEQMHKVFPEYEIQELPLSHPIFHCYFDINEVVQVPNVNYIYSGITAEKGGTVPHYEGIIDADGRVVVFIARNADN